MIIRQEKPEDINDIHALNELTLTCQWEGIPDDAFMILWLERPKAGQISGLAKYREEFNEAI